jgi:hypothetical protein
MNKNEDATNYFKRVRQLGGAILSTDVEPFGKALAVK